MQLWVNLCAATSEACLHGFSADVAVVSPGSEAGMECYYASDRLIKDGQGQVVCVRVADQTQASNTVGSAPAVLVETQGSRALMIALENIIAVARAAGTRVVAQVENADDVRGAAFALDVGVDALCLPPPRSDHDALWEAAVIARAQRLERPEATSAVDERRPTALSAATVTRVEPGVVADRVAVDLVRLLAPSEGALVGSSSTALAVVHGETLPTELVAPRPFRVNAGPVHAYVLLANGRTKYLSELEPRDEVLVVDADAGACRPVAVGRLKIETRPHLLIEFVNDDERKGQLFLQQAETVRVLTQDGDGWHPTSVTQLEPGQRIAVSFADKGTHCGIPIAAKVIER